MTSQAETSWNTIVVVKNHFRVATESEPANDREISRTSVLQEWTTALEIVQLIIPSRSIVHRSVLEKISFLRYLL